MGLYLKTEEVEAVGSEKHDDGWKLIIELNGEAKNRFVDMNGQSLHVDVTIDGRFARAISRLYAQTGVAVEETSEFEVTQGAGGLTRVQRAAVIAFLKHKSMLQPLKNDELAVGKEQ